MDSITDYFTQSHFTSMNKIRKQRNRYNRGMYRDEEERQYQQAMLFSNLFIVAIIIGILICGFLAVPHLCPDGTERGKNTRLGLYFLLIATGGQIGWLYILLWLFNINICM